MPLMHLSIDALNIAYWCGSPPGLRLPIALLCGAIAAGHQAELIFDASTRYQLPDDAALYAALLRDAPQIVIEVASGRTADALLLRHARATGGSLISNDRYRDHRRRFRKLIDDPARLLPGFVRDDRIYVPALALEVPLPASSMLAWAELKALLIDIRTES